MNNSIRLLFLLAWALTGVIVIVLQSAVWPYFFGRDLVPQFWMCLIAFFVLQASLNAALLACLGFGVLFSGATSLHFSIFVLSLVCLLPGLWEVQRRTFRPTPSYFMLFTMSYYTGWLILSWFLHRLFFGPAPFWRWTSMGEIILTGVVAWFAFFVFSSVQKVIDRWLDIDRTESVG